MRLIDGLVLNEIGDEYVVVSEDANGFKGMVRLNESAAYIFNQIRGNVSSEYLLQKLVEEYDIDAEKAAADLDKILGKFMDFGLMTND